LRNLLSFALEAAMLVAGSVLIGLVLATILQPNDIVAGGVTGIAMIAQELTGLPLGVLLVASNIPLLWLGWRHLGGRWLFLRTVVGVVLVSVSVDVANSWDWVATRDRLLVIFYGGLLSGLGLALVFRARGTTGGTDILGRLLKVWLDVEVGQAILGINVLVFAAAGWIYGVEQAAIALMVSFVMTKTLDVTLHGMVATRAALILTTRPEAVGATIRRHLRRSVVPLQPLAPEGADDRLLLSIVVPRAESARLKMRVLEADPDAFIVIHSPSETVGALPHYPDAEPPVQGF
jgi:uncharacterized membrane-anchored protein YitT (DUF2179 family)